MREYMREQTLESVWRYKCSNSMDDTSKTVCSRVGKLSMYQVSPSLDVLEDTNLRYKNARDCLPLYNIDQK